MLKLQFKDKRREPVWVVEKAFTIGRASDNNLVISDASVADHHARLVLENGNFVLHDCGGGSGTFVNGQRINQRQVGCKDTIRLGLVDLEIADPLEQDSGAPYWALIANASWLAGQEFPLTPQNGNELLIGRGSHCSIVFPGTHLSREHARVTLGDQEITLTDLDSANGTYLNDQKVTGTVTARAGDQLRLDIYSFTILGPGMTLPRSASLPTADTADTSAERDSGAPKQWRTRPTSPGNREEPSTGHTSPTLIALSALLLATLVGAIIYFLVT